MHLANKNLLHHWDLDRPSLFNKYLSRGIYVIYRLMSGVCFKIKIIPIHLANQNLLLYWVLDGPKPFNPYLNRNMLMIFGKSESLEKKHQIYEKYMHFSDVLFRIKKFLVQLANQNLLQYWDNNRSQIFTQYLSRSIFMILGKRG